METLEKTEQENLTKSRLQISLLKDIAFHTRDYLEKLATIQLDLEIDIKEAELAKQAGELFAKENEFNERLTGFISDYEMHCNRLEQGIGPAVG